MKVADEYYKENVFIPEEDFKEVSKREFEILKTEYEAIGIGHYEGSYKEITDGLKEYYRDGIVFAYIETVKHKDNYLVIEEAR